MGTVDLALFGFIPFTVCLFMVLPTRKAIIWSAIAAWLFLPIAHFKVPGLPDYTKESAASFGLLIGCGLLDPKHLLWKFRPRWFDLPISVVCLAPFLASISNDLGAYDGASESLKVIFGYGIPYWIGRVYVGDRKGLKAMALGIFVGGLIYVPLCLFEIRFSPQLHTMVYGYYQHSFGQSYRFGGWRPTVFMQHGLAVGMWMTAATLVGFILWRARIQRRVLGYSIGWLLTALSVTTILCKSTGAILLLAMGMTVFTYTRWKKVRWVLAVLIALIPLYLGSRLSGWTGSDLVEITTSANPDRAESLGFRLREEILLVNHALKRPMLGWGGWGRNRLYDAKGRNLSTTDSLWILQLGTQGLTGLVSVFLFFLQPGLRILRLGPRFMGDPENAPAVALSILMVLYAIDCLFNAMANPVFILMDGMLMTVLYSLERPGTGPRRGATPIRKERVRGAPMGAHPRRPPHPQGVGTSGMEFGV